MVQCASCRREVAKGFAFCPHCGAAIAGATAGGDERKLVTVLFADVAGSTSLAETLDAEVVRDLMGEYFAVAREEIEARGGTVEKFIGDAVMAVFGVPVTHEDDPARALRSALALRSQLHALGERAHAAGRASLRVRIGINTGEVVATSTPRPGEGMVTGDAVNLAARLQQLAEPDQIVVGERTAAASPTFTFGPLGDRQVKGKAEAVSIRELLGEIAGAEQRGVPGLRAPLVGRDSEMELLESLYERVAIDQRPQLVTVYGEPGVGKSRLTGEFLARLAARTPAPTVLRGRCLSYGSGVTFWPMAEILKSLAEILDSDSPMEVVAKIEALGARVLSTEVTPDPSRAGALLAYTVGITIPGYEFGRLEPDQLRAEIHSAWRALLSALAATAPLVVVVDDIHWADSALLDLLDDLGNRGQGAVLIMCPARPELTDRRPGWGGGRRNFSSVVLNPLPADATSQLVDQLLDVDDLPDTVHARIVERAGGNPFFVEEILRHLIDEGHIVRADSGWRAEAGLAELEIPDTVQAVLAARIDLLGPAEKRTLQAAAVVGRVFWPAPVALFLNGSAAQLDDSLRTLEDRDLVVARLATSLTGQPEYIFKHALVRDVAYESIPRRERADAHLRVADWIEDVIGERRLEVVELLAHHYTEAQRATSWANVPAARQDEIRSRAVTALYDAAWEAARHLNSERARERARVGLELASGPIERARGLEVLVPLDLWADDASAAWREACEAVDLRVLAGPTTPEERRAIAAGCARALEIPTRWPGLMRTLPRREDAAPYLELGMQYLPDGDSEERVGLLMANGAWSWGFGESILDPHVIADERKSSEEAVAMARRLGRPQLLSATLDMMGATGVLLRGYAGQMETQEERIKLLPKLDDIHEIVDIYGTSAWGLTHVGRFRRAAEMGRQGMESGEGLGILNYVPGAFLAVAQFRLAEWDAFWQTAGQVDGALDPTKPLRYHAHRVYGVSAYIKDVTGDVQAADRFIDRLDRSQVDLGAVGVAGARSWIVAVLARRGEFAAARERLAVVDPVRDIQNRDLTYEAWADLIATEGAWDEAPAIVAAARDWAERTGLELLPAICDRLEGQAALAAGNPQSAIDLLTRARDTFDRLEAVWERARTDLSLAEAQLTAGTDPNPSVQAALEVFSRLGASREEARSIGLSRP